MHGDLRIDVEEIASLRTYELGELDGVELCFSDATPLGDGLVVFTASAEDDDGAIHGSVIGLLDPGGDVTRLRRIDRSGRSRASTRRPTPASSTCCSSATRTSPTRPVPLLGASMPIERGLE